MLRIREAERAKAENIRVSVNVVELKKQPHGRLGARLDLDETTEATNQKKQSGKYMYIQTDGSLRGFQPCMSDRYDDCAA